MTDIVERLDRLATWGGKATHLDYEGAILDAKAEIERLRADNARLRAALRCFLEDERFVVSVGGNPHVVERMIEEARAALEGK